MNGMSNLIQPTEEWNDIYWAYNMPLQMWQAGSDEDIAKGIFSWRVLNYMPRKEICKHLDCLVTKEELPTFCKNAASILRNLANLFDALGEGKIKTIYYPDKTVEEAMKDEEEDG